MIPLDLQSRETVRHGIAAKVRLDHIGVVIPTFNAAKEWPGLERALEKQGLGKDQILIIDSSSSDETPVLVARAGYHLVTIPKEDFGHGRTRQLASEHMPWAEILLYITQDAIPAEVDSIEKLCDAFDDPQVGATYGRQIPRDQARAIERHARLFNYPAVSEVRTFESRNRLGIKTAFLSNSFAAYRRSALEEVGGFPVNVIIAEDSIVAARLLMAGWKVAYQSDATVIHSHSMSIREEFARYFDTGVHHTRESWLLEKFGTAGQEGRRFVLSELRFLKANEPLSIPVAVLRTANKWFAYQLGRRESRLPDFINRFFSGHPHFWNDQGSKR
ncbi:O antigen biosynthesis rhamnosyltransferase RfbN [soil metagenome]